MVAIDKKTNQRYQVVKYSLRVIERGSDTDFGTEKMELYNPLSRYSFTVDSKDYWIVHDWNTPAPEDEIKREKIKGLEEKIRESEAYRARVTREIDEARRKLQSLKS